MLVFISFFRGNSWASFIQPPVGKLITLFDIAAILIASIPIPNIVFVLLLAERDLSYGYNF
tara:strand:- start:821 stop:1003 length:183 start_codon:yes stop_codon:yes gene_type:complete